MFHRRIFLLSLLLMPLAAGAAQAGLAQAGSQPLLAAAEQLKPMKAAELGAALSAEPAGKAGPAASTALPPADLLPQKAENLNKMPPVQVQEETSKTELDFSFGDDDDARPLDGGLNKDTGTAAVGLRHNFSDNWHMGGGALFQGRGRGAAANLGFSW